MIMIRNVWSLTYYYSINNDYSSDNDSFEYGIHVVDKHLSSSRYGACGSALQSALLPSDAEQMLRVRLSMSHSRESMPVPSVFLQSLREEASLMPQYVFDELCIQYPNLMQLQRLMSQDWMRSWDRWIHVQDMLDMYDKEDMRKWLCQHAVI